MNYHIIVLIKNNIKIYKIKNSHNENINNVKTNLNRAKNNTSKAKENMTFLVNELAASYTLRIQVFIFLIKLNFAMVRIKCLLCIYLDLSSSL